MIKKEIIWNNEKWIIDYRSGTIYKSGNEKFENYSFSQPQKIIYFKTPSGFYKVENDEVVMISEDEYKKLEKYIYLEKNDDYIGFISKYVSSIMIDEVLRAKHNIKISTKVENLDILLPFLNKFPPSIKKRISDISESIIDNLPYVDKTAIKQEVEKVLLSLFDGNMDYLSEMINIIYKNDKNRFDHFANNIIEDRKRKLQYENGLASKTETSYGDNKRVRI